MKTNIVLNKELKFGTEKETYKNTVLIEERHYLSDLLYLLMKKIQFLKSNKPYPDVHPYSVGSDWEDREDLKYKKSRNYEVEKQIDDLSEFQDCPYFARMDFKEMNQKTGYEKVYIGKKGLSIDGHNLVFDWRSPVGQRYYLKNEIEFNHNSYVYTLLLRRALNIKNSNLISYNDEYVFGDGIFKDGITDPFLINALREKRGSYRVTDIIKTIQENQNNIIRFPTSTSFIVQGCAGSGKTMILLHRLSQMIFNNPNLDFSKIKIITPNENFNMHINDLYEELELDRIGRYKVDDYYLYLLYLYPLNNRKKNAVILSDAELDRQFVKKIYSEDFYYSCIKRYEEYINEVYNQLSLDKIISICDIHDLNRSFSLQKNDYDSIKSYIGFINSLVAENKKNIVELGNTIENIKIKQTEVDKLIHNLAFITIIRLYENEKSRLHNEKEDLERVSHASQSTCHLVCKRYKGFNIDDEVNLIVQFQKILDENNKREKSANLLAQNLLVAQTEYQDCVRTRQKIINWELGQKDSLSKVQEELDQLPFWKFASRQRLRSTAQELKERLMDNHTEYLHATDEIKKSDDLIKQLSAKLSSFDKKIMSEEDRSLIHTLLESEKELNVKKQKIETEIIKLESDYLGRTGPVTQKVELLNSEIEKLEENADQLKKNILSAHDLELFSQKLIFAQEIDFEHIYMNTIQFSLDKLCQIHSLQLPNSKPVYRYTLFLELLCHSLFEGKLVRKDRFLNIDEGQDLAATEYLLLKAIHGEDLILNIYGDINQMISEKGITDWKNIKGISQQFLLNENYRSTEQITKYCNEKLEFSFTPIGVSGEPVRNIPMAEMIEEIERIAASHHSERWAIIVKNYSDATVGKWLALGCSKGILRDGIIPLLSVEDAKGLEFERVFVIDGGMSKNEKYISYTRALQELVLVRA